MRLTQKNKADAVETIDVKRIVRVPAAEGASEKFVVSRVTVEESAEADHVAVESEGRPAGVLIVRKGLGERISRWLLADARIVGVE